ncbi:MAG: UvrD-helicase domain-containing protein [Pseudanabaena sp. M051S1SP2A07QC]|nr:UvrD-helicase domain-containing protein [Pseudanabaena sp. M051S1SP2A07QC]
MTELIFSTTANPKQLEAFATTDSPLLIIAGPGAGKTFTLVERIVYLITHKKGNYSGWRFGKKWFPRNTCMRDARTLTPCFLRVEI